MTDEGAIRSIAVAGGGIVGLSAALAFARALPRTRVGVIGTLPDAAALADRLPVALPGVERFHAAIGFDEADLVRAGIATHHLGTVLEGWSTSGESWVHAFGGYGEGAGAIPFDSIWVHAHKLGNALAYDRYSVAAALIRARKFVHPSTDPDFIGSRFAYGLRLDPKRYHERLRSEAQRAGIAFADAGIADVERNDDGGIAALRLADGARVEADLFVDCTGPAALLIGSIDSSFEDWSAWLPFDRLRLADEPGDEAPSPSDRVCATEHGWTARWPLRGRTVHASLSLNGADAEGESVTLTRGRRLRPWVANVLALGDSATALDPLHGFNLDAAHSLILLALELLPRRNFHPLETHEYNRRAEQVTRRIRDFVALHYLRSGRTDGMWGDFATTQPPDSLARTLDQYEHRGRMPFHEDESVTRDSWTAALLGMGVVPRNVDPQAAGVPLDQALPAMERLADEIETAVATLPAYSEYLARITAARR